MKNCNCNHNPFSISIPSLNEGIFPECYPPKNMVYFYKRDDNKFYYYDQYGREYPFLNNMSIPKQYTDPNLNSSSTTTKYIFGADSPLYTVIDLGIYQNLVSINAYNEGGPRIYEHNILLLNNSSNIKTLEYTRIIPPDGTPIPSNNIFTIQLNPNERKILHISAFGGYITASQITV